jgi:hypothetical protein
VFLDELPWLASPRSDFLSALDHFWNTFASRQRNLVVVICARRKGGFVGQRRGINHVLVYHHRRVEEPSRQFSRRRADLSPHRDRHETDRRRSRVRELIAKLAQRDLAVHGSIVALVARCSKITASARTSTSRSLHLKPRDPGTYFFRRGLAVDCVGQVISPRSILLLISINSRRIGADHFWRMAGTSRPWRITATIAMNRSARGSNTM